MFPVLLTIGNFPVSSYGLFLALGIFFGGFVIWRLARAYDQDAEKILDMIFLTIGSSLILARLVFVLAHLNVFDSFTKIIFLNRYPGMSLWGGIIGGLIVLSWLSKRNKVPFLQVGDFAMIGLLLGSFFAEIGCFLGGCGVGVPTNLIIGVNQVGVIGPRLPIQIFEALAFLFIFFRFWKASLKFYIQGIFLAKGLIYFSLIKIIASFFKAEPVTFSLRGFNLDLDLILPILVLIYGFKLYYQVNKKTPKNDLASTYKLISNRKAQSAVVTRVSRGWYNHWVNLRVSLNRGKKRLFKLLNIKSNPENF